MKITGLLVWLLLPLVLGAQQGYTFNRISTDDALGLSSNMVYCTYQDSRGYIWVGTANGLQRFDGSKFVGFGSSSPGARQLPVSDLQQIIPGDSNQLFLFFGSRSEVWRFHATHFKAERIELRPGRHVPARNNQRLWRSQRGDLYWIIWKYGLLKYNPATRSFTDDNSFRLPAGWISDVGIFEDTLKKQIWFPCPDSGLAVHDLKSGQTWTPRNNPNRIPLLEKEELRTHPSEIFIDSRRRHWVFNWAPAQYKRCYDEQGRLLPDTAGINDNPEYSELRQFFESRQGVLWVYGNNGLFNFDNTARRFYFYPPIANNPTGIGYDDVKQVMEDRDGSLWVSTNNGLYFTTPGSGTYGVVNLLFNEARGGIEITDLLQLSGKQYWLSTWGRGVLTMNTQFDLYDAGIYRDMPRLDEVSNAQYRQTWALYQHKDGKVWIGCQGGKLIIYDTVSRRSLFTSVPQAENATIRYITADRKGNIWLSTQRGHLIVYDGKTYTTVQQLGTIVPRILVDKQDQIWMATLNQGLYCLSPDGRTVRRHYKAGDSRYPLFVNVSEDLDLINDSTLAAGAGALHLINTRTGQVRMLTFDDGLPSNTIQRIRADKDGNLWIITLNGLCRYNPHTNRFTPYGRKDGITLAGQTTKTDFRCQDDFIMFAGANALMFFQPSLYTLNEPPPDVVITDFKLFNEYIPVDSLLAQPRLRFGPGENSFTIYFSSLSYSQKEKLTYYYMLEGIDKEWIRAGQQGFANYPSLPGGTYTFKVYSENIDGMKSRHVTTLTLHVRQPFWKTYWFISTLLLFFTLLGYLLHRLRVNRLLAVEKIRNRVARDLHDDMGSTLSTINILSTMAKSKLQTDTVRTSEFISKISENSQRMMEAMDDIVWSIKPTNDSMAKIVARMREYATSILEARDIEVKFDIPEEVNDVSLDMETRRDFFLVFKEAVNNAAKYSGAKRVELIIRTAHQRLYLEVKDDGRGFDVKTADGGNGLGNMQKRSDAMRGQLRIDSAPGQGTRVQLTIPVQ